MSLAPDGTLALTALDPEHGASIYYAHDVMLEPMIFVGSEMCIRDRYRLFQRSFACRSARMRFISLDTIM